MPNEFPVSIVLKALDKLSGPVRQMGEPFQKLSGVVGNLRTNFKTLQLTQADAMKSLTKRGEGMEKLGKRLSVGATLPLTAFGAFAIKSAGDFESSMNAVQASTGATKAEFLSLRNEALKVGSTTQYSSSEAAEAIATLAKSGMDTNSIISKMPGLVSLASASNIGLAETASHVTDVFESYNVEAEKSSVATDMLAKSIYLGKGNLQEFSEATAQFGPIAAGMNQPLNETLAIFSALSKAGMRGGRTGSSLAGSLEALRDPGEGAVRTLTKLGIRASMVMDKNRNITSLINVIELLRQKGATTSDLMSIFGTKGARAMQALIKQGPGLRKLSDEIQNSAGAAEKLSAIRDRGFNDAFKGLGNAIQALGIAIGDSGVLQFLTMMVQLITSVVNWLSKTSPWVLQVAFAIGALVAIIGPMLILLGTMAQGFAVLLPLLGALKIAFLAVSAVMLATPLGWITLGVVAFAGAAFLVIRNWTLVRDFFLDMWGKLKDKFSYFSGMASAAASFGSSLGSQIGSSVVGQSNSNSNVVVSFENMPRGARVSSPTGNTPVDLRLGYTMEAER